MEAKSLGPHGVGAEAVVGCEVDVVLDLPRQSRPVEQGQELMRGRR